MCSGDWFCCFSSCKPRYKRLVDAIYPRTVRDGLVSGNMQKLTFYSISHPEKLNRIGIYMVLRLSRDLYRQRYFEVKVAVDAIDQLLKSCHGSPSLNQFIESYLRMVQKLLETNDPQMEKLATDLFVRFSTIEEDSPSYHRQYDFFISKFSSMCHSTGGEHVRSRRYNGLRGLRGVIWKSASDDLQANIWAKQHMNKIIPSILYNFQEDDEDLEEHVDQGTSMLFHHYPDDNLNADDPRSLALQCLRELFGKCNFGTLKTVLEPVFKHFDLHQKWDAPATFAVTTFKAILCSIQTQNSSFVIQELINHLEHMPNHEVQVRIGIATVLSSIVSIAGTTIGPLLLAIFNSLLKRLRSSVEFQQSKQCADPPAEKIFQETLINALGDFANALPDYQKLEIMMFTMGNIPTIRDDERTMKVSDAFLQKVLVKTILKVATKYKTYYLATVFTDSFLKTLLQLTLINDSEVRLIALQIFHTLLDRHDNLEKLEHLLFVVDVLELQLTIEKCSRHDQLFMRRHIHNIIFVLYRSIVNVDKDCTHLNETVDAILCLMSLLCVEVGHDENLIELFRLAFALQLLAVENANEFGSRKTCAVHNLVAKYLNFSSQLLAIPTLCNHIQQVIKSRAQRGNRLLNIMSDVYGDETAPAAVSNNNGDDTSAKAPIAQMDSEEDFTARSFVLDADSPLLFDLNTVAEALKASNKDVAALMTPLKPMALSSNNNAVDFMDSMTTPPVDRTRTHSDTVLTGAVLPRSPAARGVEHRAAHTAETQDDIVLRRSPDQSSIESSSIDWSPPESRHHSRRNTVFNLNQTSKLVLPITVESLRATTNAPIDAIENEKNDLAKSAEILSAFRNKTANELMDLFTRHDRYDSPDPSTVGGSLATTDVEGLSQTLERVNKRNAEWSKMVEFGHNFSHVEDIFDVKFPSFFVN